MRASCTPQHTCARHPRTPAQRASHARPRCARAGAPHGQLLPPRPAVRPRVRRAERAPAHRQRAGGAREPVRPRLRRPVLPGELAWWPECSCYHTHKVGRRGCESWDCRKMVQSGSLGGCLDNPGPALPIAQQAEGRACSTAAPMHRMLCVPCAPCGTAAAWRTTCAHAVPWRGRSWSRGCWRTWRSTTRGSCCTATGGWACWRPTTRSRCCRRRAS